MVLEFKKYVSRRLSKYFTSTDFDCKCTRHTCKKTLVDEKLAPALDLLWEKAGPFRIDSGFRCQEHNTEVGGEKGSKHMLGQAADCRSFLGKTGYQMALIAETIPAFENGGIGTYNTFAHCDVREVKTRWDYSNNGREKNSQTT